MNQDASTGGTPVLITDGEETGAGWAGSNISGTKIKFASTNRPETGTKSVYVDNPGLNNVWEWDKGSSQALTGFASFSMGVNVDKDWSVGDSIEVYGWDGAAEVGTRVKLEDYFDELFFDVWQGLAIPLADMNLVGETITAMRMQFVAKDGKAPKFYIDNFNLEETGGEITFTAVSPVKDKRYFVQELVITVADALAGTVADGTMTGLAYNKFMSDLAYTNGFQLVHRAQGQNRIEFPVTNLGDLLATGATITNTISDGINSMAVITLAFDPPLVLVGPGELSHIAIRVRDNMSGLLRFTALVRGGVEL